MKLNKIVQKSKEARDKYSIFFNVIELFRLVAFEQNGGSLHFPQKCAMLIDICRRIRL